MKHLLTLRDWPAETIADVLDLADAVKAAPGEYENHAHRKTLFMLFEKPSLRTRVSFEVAMNQMGGAALYYDLMGSPLGAGKETISDTAKCVSRYADIVMARVYEHEKLEEMAAAGDIPVINGLSNSSHPCQALADLMTVREKKGTLENVTLTYVGDSNNNVTHSLMYICAKLGVNVRVGCPAAPDYAPAGDVVASAQATAKKHGAEVTVTHDAAEAVADADVVYTDSWMSYHVPKEEQDARVADLMPFQVNAALMANAKADAVFLNCLPALRGFEQTAEVIDGPQSVVFDQAENRLHAQKAVIISLLG